MSRPCSTKPYAAMLFTAAACAALAQPALAQTPTVKGRPISELLSSGGRAAYRAMVARRAAGPRISAAVPGDDEEEGGLISDAELSLPTLSTSPDYQWIEGGGRGNGGTALGRNAFVNDPCLDPSPLLAPPFNRQRTMQSETEIAVLNRVPNNGGGSDGDDNGSSGRLMVAGYNDSWGFYNNRQGLSGYGYSTDGGQSWIDGGGLPPLVKTGAPAGTAGQDAYFGDPVVVVHHRSRTFYYASIYQTAGGIATLSVNRGQFRVAAPQNNVEPESQSNTRCQGNPAAFGIPDPPATIRERIIWEKPVAAVSAGVGQTNDFIDKEWLYVDQRTGELYLAYVRFAADGSTPLELVRSLDGGQTWTPPSVIVPNLDDTFNQGVSVVTTTNRRVVVSWFARTFPAPTFVEREQRIETAYSNNDGLTFSAPVLVSRVNPQGEPPGYNRGRTSILNVTYLAVDKGNFDGAQTSNDNDRGTPGYGNVYVSYFSGKTPIPQTGPAVPPGGYARAGDIFVSASEDNASSWGPRVKVNTDNTPTSHVFPSVQVNKRGTVFVTWVDRRVDPFHNLLTDTWGAFSDKKALAFASNVRISDVSTDWVVRSDGRPNFGDYNSSEVIDFDQFGSIWSDGRFPPPVPLTCLPSGACSRPSSGAATPDVLFSIVGNGK